ncbi:hypothetical protein FOA24_24940 [Bacillus thuringiensis]|uniref:hypothetical protein n=1 Tax=Bacillus thuringiensis TaxID=1428 RepID=UPI003337DBD6
MNPHYMNDCDCHRKNSLTTAADTESHFLLDWGGKPVVPSKRYRAWNYLYSPLNDSWARAALTAQSKFGSQYARTIQGFIDTFFLDLEFYSLMDNPFINMYEGINIYGINGKSGEYFGQLAYNRDYNAISLGKSGGIASLWYPERISGPVLPPVPAYYFKNSDSQQYLGSLGGNGWLRGGMNPEDPNVYCYFAMEPLF